MSGTGPDLSGLVGESVQQRREAQRFDPAPHGERVAATITWSNTSGAGSGRPGSGHLFGVPGDFNLTLLDHFPQVPGPAWVSWVRATPPLTREAR